MIQVLQINHSMLNPGDGWCLQIRFAFTCWYFHQKSAFMRSKIRLQLDEGYTPNSFIWTFTCPRPSPVSTTFKCIIKSLLIHILALLYTCEISPKYRCTYKATNSQAALTHFLGCTLDKGMPQCIRHWSVTAAAVSEGWPFKARSSRCVCAMAIGSCFQGLGSLSRAPLFATRTWAETFQTKAPVRKTSAFPPPFGMWLDHHRRAKTRWKWLPRYLQHQPPTFPERTILASQSCQN